MGVKFVVKKRYVTLEWPLSIDLAAQSMDPYSAQKSMDCAEICGSRRVQSTDLPVLYPDQRLSQRPVFPVRETGSRTSRRVHQS